MPQIIVTANQQTEGGEPPIVFRERVSTRDFESSHFLAQLAERLGWAVGDAHAVECTTESEHRAEHERMTEPEHERMNEAEAEREEESDLDSLPMPGLSPVVGRAW